MCGRCVHVQTTCRRRPDDICHPPAEISNEVSLSCHPHVVRTSSTRHLRVVCTSSATRFQPQNISSQRAESSSAKNKETGEPKRVNVRDLKLKDPAEDWELKAEEIGRGAKFVNDPSNLPDIDWIPENDISYSPDKDKGNPDKVPNKATDKTKTYGLRRHIKPPQKLDL